MKSVISISLGSSKRDMEGDINVLGQNIAIKRIGCDGSVELAKNMIKNFDGKTTVITLGGTDIYLKVAGMRYTIPLGKQLEQCAKITPVVDGSRIKQTYERKVIEYIVGEKNITNINKKKILIVSAVDRFGMTEELMKFSKNIIFGDLVFADIIDWPIRDYWLFKIIANFYLSHIMPKMRFQDLYPTGRVQDHMTGKFQRYFDEADIIVGDWLMIKKNLSPIGGFLTGKTIITNTVTVEDIRILREKKLGQLITYTFKIGERSFGTNVMDGVFVAILGKKLDEIKDNDYYEIINKLNLKPEIMTF